MTEPLSDERLDQMRALILTFGTPRIDEWRLALERALDEIDRLSAEKAELLDALRPLKGVFQEHEESWRDNSEAMDDGVTVHTCLGDCRRAAELVARHDAP